MISVYSLAIVTQLLTPGFTPSGFAGGVDGLPISPQLVQELEDALAERMPEIPARLRLVEQIDQHFSAMAPEARSANEMWLKTRFVEAVANMRLSELELSAQQILILRDQVDTHRFPELSFRCRSLEAALLVLRGRWNESLPKFEELLASDLSQVPQRLIGHARVNYAIALNESNRCDEAVELYEAIMLESLERNQDLPALHAASSVLAILLNEGNAEGARQLLDELEPVVKRNPTAMPSQAIALRRLEVQGLEGQHLQAIEGLKSFIDLKKDLPPVFLSLAHRILAAQLRQAGRLDEAISHAKEASMLVTNMLYEIPRAHLFTAELLLESQDYEGALKVLSALEPVDRLPLEAQKRHFALKLQTQLRMGGRDQEVHSLQMLLEAGKAKEKQLSAINARSLESRLHAVQNKLKAQELAARTLAEQESNRANRYLRNFTLTLLGFLALSGIGLAVVSMRRRAERVKLTEQQLQNARLEALVESKTRELKANMEAQAEMTKALERKKRVETVGLLAGNVAHDINNLLQVIANANETLANPELSPELRRQALSISNDSLRHGTGVIQQILAYSRKPEMAPRPVCVSDYLKNSRALFQSAVGRRVDLELIDQCQQAKIEVDSSQLTTAIINLLTNAADAMHEGGTVTIRAEHYEQPQETTSNWSHVPPGRYLSLSVCDPGCGMSAEHVARAFEPFFSTKSVGSGTGLGLTSVQNFVRSSGGDVRLESQLGAGTVVELLLPISATACAAAPHRPELSHPQLNQKRLLLVEDNAAVAKSLLVLLPHLHLQSQWVASGDEAQQLLQQDSHFDFVLSDIHMPGALDGVALAGWIGEQLPHVRVVLMSGYNDLDPAVIQVPLLHKPFPLTDLASLLVDKSDLRIGSH